MFDIFTLIITGATLIGMAFSGRQIPKVNIRWDVIFIISCIILVFTAPEGFDKHMYRNIFLTPGKFIKDAGWETYNAFWRVVFLDNADLFFFCHDTIYTLGFVYFAAKTFPRQYIWYYILVAFISMGYYNGGTNIMRSGFAMSLVFYGLAGFQKDTRHLVRLGIFCAFACMIHLSTGLIVGALAVSYLAPKWKWYVLAWCAFVALSWANVLSPVAKFLSDILGTNSNRLDNYVHDKGYLTTLYANTGFRIDFIIYSAVPIVFAIFYLTRYKLRDSFYTMIFCTYLIGNAIWLVLIHMPFNDRVALMSWIFIPLLTVYPPLKHNIPHAKKWLAASIVFPTLLTIYYLI